MANFNRVLLVGNLTRDPEIRYTNSGTAVANFGMAVNRNYRSQDGENRQEVCFIDISAWGKQGEIISEYVSKGDPILIEGRLRMDTWQGQDGQRRTRHEVVVENFQFLPRGGGRSDNDYQGQQQRQPRNSGGPRQGNQQQYRPDNPPPQQGPDPADDAFGGDDIPF